MKLFLGAATVALLASPAMAGITINYEAPGVQNSTAVFDVVGVETFEGRSAGSDQTFTTDFGTAGMIVAEYKDVRIDSANVFGSSGGTGNHAVTFIGDGGYDVEFSTVLPTGLNYFGYWLSALDNQNRIDFFDGDTLLGTITPADIKASIGNCPSAYCGNPDAPFTGGNAGEPYAFLNVYFTGGDTYDRIRFYQVGGGGYESDNHTVGYFLETGGVPEPATWAMLITGFGLVGFAARRRRNIAVSA